MNTISGLHGFNQTVLVDYMGKLNAFFNSFHNLLALKQTKQLKTKMKRKKTEKYSQKKKEKYSQMSSQKKWQNNLMPSWITW